MRSDGASCEMRRYGFGGIVCERCTSAPMGYLSLEYVSKRRSLNGIGRVIRLTEKHLLIPMKLLIITRRN